jgi:NAD(P)-dependent dehydrogenase (short-subunit alcohol dehydrogenase family)
MPKFMSDRKTAIVTGAPQGIGAGVVEGFLKVGYNVVATSRNVNRSSTASPSVIFVEGDIGKQETAAKTVEAAIQHFATIDVLVNNAGIYRTKAFTDFTTGDFKCPGLDEPAGIPLHDSAQCETDVETEIGKRCDHLCGPCRSAYRRRKCLGVDDDEGRPEHRDPESRH